MLLRWGILGVARINNALIPPLKSSDRHRLVAIASRDAARAERAAREWDIPRAHGSYEALLSDPEIDAVYVPLPNGLHAEWTVKAAAAGKHVLCEKPLALSAAEVNRIEDAAKRAGVVVAEAFMYRHHPQTLLVRERVAAGAVGEVRLIKGAFSFPLKREGDVRLDPGQGGGSLWDVGCYPVSYARYVLGEEPTEVFGWAGTGETGVDLTFVGQMRFPSGAFASFDCGFRAPLRAHMEIVGSEGSLSIPEPFKPGLATTVTLSREGRSEAVAIRGQDLYRGEIDDLADAALAGRSPRVSLEDSRGNVRCLVSLYRSAVEGRPVSLA